VPVAARRFSCCSEGKAVVGLPPADLAIAGPKDVAQGSFFS